MLVGQSLVANHGNEVFKRDKGVGVSGDEGSPGYHNGRWDLVEDSERVGMEVGFGVESDVIVLEGALVVDQMSIRTLHLLNIYN